jgi:ABC-type transport system substrate-binding protein
MFKKWVSIIVVLLALSLVLAACQSEPEVVEVTRVITETVTETVELEGETVEVEVEVTRVVVEEVEVEVEVPAEEPAEEGGEIAAVYRIALFEDPVAGFNYWNYLGPGSSVWTSYVQSGFAASLYTLSDQRFDFVPQLATDLPEEPVQEGDLWTITVPMVADATWSDGEPITAHDAVFTHNACMDLQLTSNWVNQCIGLDHVEAVDDNTVKFYFTDKPGLGTWQAGVALAPILPQHFWGDIMAASYAFVDGLEAPTIELPEGVDCEAEDLSADDQTACDAYAAEWDPYNEAFTNARTTLYEADGAGTPVFGGYTTDQFEPGAFVQRTANSSYYLTGSRVTEYDDGTWVLENPNGQSHQLYGDATGEVTLDFEGGPYSENILFSIYGSQDAAFLALADGEVDYVMNPLGLSRGLKEQAEQGGGVRAVTNADYGMFYLAFNMRKEPMSFPEFREAFDIIMDKEFVVNNVLQGAVFPMYSTMPPGNGFWHNADVPKPHIGKDRETRINEAVALLKDAGWSWDVEPAWNADTVDVDPGQGMTMPNGQLVPELTILGPGPSYDPLRATYNQWISEWGRELGVPVESELTGFNTILNPVFVDANFDMYILGWSLGNVAFPDYYDSFWHSKNDTATTGNFNTPGYNSPEYDAMTDEFMGTTDLARARDLVFEMQVLLANDRPYIPLFYKQVTDLLNSDLKVPYEETLGGIEAATGFQTDAYVLSR